MAENTNITFEILFEKLKNNEPFTFLRFGNGEFDCIFQDTGRTHNKNGCHYHRKLGQALRKLIEQPLPYYIGLQSLALKQRPKLKEYFPQNWCQGDLLHYASIHLKFKPFLELLKQRKTLLIGNRTLRKIGLDIHEIPAKNLWFVYSDYKRVILAQAKNYDVICMCGGLAGKLLIHELYTLYPEKTIIDLGSVLDPYAGVVSRKYHADLITKI